MNIFDAYHTDNALIAYIRKLMEEKGVKQTELSEKTGMAYQSLHRILNCRSPLYLDDAVKIAQALDVNIGELVRKAADNG